MKTPNLMTHPAARLYASRIISALFVLLYSLFLSNVAVAQVTSITIDQAVLDVDNTTVFDHQGDTPEYVVLKNNTASAIELAGWSLSDDTAVPNKWMFPTSAALAANATMTVFASGKNYDKVPFATNFRLPCPSQVCLYQQTSLRDIRDLTGPACGLCIPLIQSGSNLQWLIPSANTPSNWNSPNFTGSFRGGKNCIGYDGDPLCDGFILYSTFDRTTGIDTTNRIVFDLSGPYLHQGTYSANTITTLVAGKVAESVKLSNGQNVAAPVIYPDHPELDPGTASYTFAIWVNPASSPGGTQVLFHKYDLSKSNGYVMLRPEGGASFTIGDTGSSVTASSSPGLPLNAWTHLVSVIDRGAGQLRLYRNGTLADTKPIPPTASINLDNSTNLILGQTIPGTNFLSYPDRADEFAIWARALTSTEISTIHSRSAGSLLPAVGYKTDTSGNNVDLYANCIQTDVEVEMKGVNTSAYVRIPFAIPDASLVSKLILKMKYDDGFIAYINGVKVAERNAPTAPVWNAAATIDRVDTDALTAETIDVSSGISALFSGPGNILAIHGLNFTVSDLRFLVCPELCYEEEQQNDCYQTTNGRDFWIAFPANAPEDTTNPLVLNVCITGTSGTTGVVSSPGLGFSTPYSIPAGGSVTVPITKNANLLKSDLIENKGINITATQEVAVYAKTREDFTTDTYLAIPTTLLGSEYLALGYRNVWIGYPDLNGSQFAIVAPQDGTRVTVKPIKATGVHPSGVPYSFTLNKGQTYLLRNDIADTAPGLDDLTGSEILSDKPVAVFGGHRCANVNGTSFFCDIVVEQILPVALWSTEFVSTPLKTRSGPDTLRVLASVNKTLVSIDGVPKALLDRGEVFETVEAVGRFISADNPVMVAQYSNSSDYDGVTNSDPFQINLQPIYSWLSAYKVCTPPAAQFGGNYINVVAGSSADIASVSILPAPVATEGPIVMFGGRAYMRYTVAANTVYTITGRSIGLTQYGFDEYDSYGNSGGMGFNDKLPPTFNYCPADLTVFCDDTPNGCFYALPEFKQLLQITDNCCLESRISVIQSITPGTTLMEGDYVVTVWATDCNGNTSQCVINLHVRKNWQQQNFPAAYPLPYLEQNIWGWTADADRDGLVNRMEYALGTDPNVPNGQVPAVQVNYVTDQGVGYLEITYRKRRDDPSLEYMPQGADGLLDWVENPGHFVIQRQVPDSLPGFDKVTERCLDSARPPQVKYFLRLLVRQR